MSAGGPIPNPHPPTGLITVANGAVALCADFGPIVDRR